MLPAIIVIGLTIAAVYRRGALHNGDAALVGAVSLVVAAWCVVCEPDRIAGRVALTFGGFAAWWLATAAWHLPVHFLPLGASILAFAGALLAMRLLVDSERAAAATALVCVGTVSAVIGLVGVAFRLFPVAERAQQLWRASTTLTYSNAAGLLLAMSLLLALGLDARSRPVRLALCLCTAGLVATQSRGAMLALVVSLPFVARGQLRGALRFVVAGLVAGLAVVATSSMSGRQPAVLLAVVAASAVACVLPPGPGRWRDRRGRAVTVVGVAVLVAALAVTALGAPLSRRVSDDRAPEWTAVFHQWRSAPLFGVGPDKPLVLDASTHTVAYFASSEYLQVLADGGLIGGVLLVAAALAVGSAMTRRDRLAAGALSAVVAFAVGGAVDFVWHLPALALFAGAAAGLSCRPAPVARLPDVPTH